MEEPSDSGQFFDASPYLKLFIDKEGRWFQNGSEIIHPQIYRYFNQMLEKTPADEYRVRLGREICRVEVEDAPFVVTQVLETSDKELSIELNDGTVEVFVPDHFWIGETNIPYVTVKNGEFHARFSRPAYHRLSQFIVSDDEEKQFFLDIAGNRTPITMHCTSE